MTVPGALLRIRPTHRPAAALLSALVALGASSVWAQAASDYADTQSRLAIEIRNHVRCAKIAAAGFSDEQSSYHIEQALDLMGDLDHVFSHNCPLPDATLEDDLGEPYLLGSEEAQKIFCLGRMFARTSIPSMPEDRRMTMEDLFLRLEAYKAEAQAHFVAVYKSEPCGAWFESPLDLR